MSKYSIVIGDKPFDSKSKALAFYRNILTSYEIGETLNLEDYTNVVDLVYADFIKKEIQTYEAEYDSQYDGEKISTTSLVQLIRNQIQDYDLETGEHISSIKVDFHPEFKNTKCFYLICGKEVQLFSYLLAINGEVSDSQRFSKACRNLVEEQLREFKKQQFKNRPVKCAITNTIIEWGKCQIDHKAPLTFSVIVKSFIIANKINFSELEYIGEITKEKFASQELAKQFTAFHKEMAVLRLLSTKQNQKLSGGARIKPTKRDGTLT